MKSLFTPILAGLSFVSASALAAYDQDFQHEVSVAASDNTSDSKNDTHWKGQYTYYANPVEQTNGPYRVNAFLAHTSQFSLLYGHQDEDNEYGIKGKLFFADHWFVAAEYEQSEFLGDDVYFYSLEVGNYINEFTKVYVSAARHDIKDKISDLEIDTYSLGVKSFISLEHNMGLLLKAAYLYEEAKFAHLRPDQNKVKLEADYFFTQSFSIGAHYDNGDEDDANYGVKADYFFRITDNISLDVGVNKYFEDDYKSDGTNWKAKLIGRF